MNLLPNRENFNLCLVIGGLRKILFSSFLVFMVFVNIMTIEPQNAEKRVLNQAHAFILNPSFQLTRQAI